MFKTRLLSGILLVIIALATIISGDYVLFFTLLAVSLIGMRELYRAMKVQDEKINLLAAAGYLGAVLYYLAVLLDFERYGVLAIIFGLVLLMFVYVFTYPTYEAGQVMPALFGIVYVAVMLSFIYLTRELPGGKFHVWLIFLCSWGCDTCAYCVGMLIGIAAERIQLAHQVALRASADIRVARHQGDAVHADGKHDRLESQSRACQRRLTAGVSRPDDRYIIIFC